MKNTMWIVLLVALIARPSIAEVTRAEIVITPPFVVEDITTTVSFTCTGDCAQGPCEFIPPSGAITKAFNRNDDDNTFSCTVKDTGDNQTQSTSESFAIYYGPDSDGAGIYSRNRPQGPELKVIKGQQSDAHSIECRRGACSNCTLSWTGPISPAPTSKTSLLLFASNTVLQKEHTGAYTCKAVNEATGKTWERNLKITVRYAPEVTLEWMEKTKTLRCTAQGVPATYSNAVILHKIASTSYTVRTFTKPMINGVANLKFNHTDYQETGNYSCTTNNGITSQGEFNKTDYAIRVFQDKPLVVQSVDSYNVSKGDELNIVMRLYTLPASLHTTLIDPEDNIISTVQTTRTELVHTAFHGVLVNVPGMRLTVHIAEVLEPYFNGSLKLLIGNDIGNVQKTVTLYPEGAPDIPGNFSTSEKTHNMARFVLVTGYFNGAHQTLVVEYRKPGNMSEWVNGTMKEAGTEKNNLFQLYVYHLEPEATYEFRAYSYNEYAKSDYTTVITEILLPTPLPLALIIGLSSGVIVIIILVIIIACFVKKRNQGSNIQKQRPNVYQNTELTASFPASPGFDNNEYTTEPLSRDRDSADSYPDHQTYVNTQIGPSKQVSIQEGKQTRRQESVIYQNTQLMTTFGRQNSGGNTLSADDTEQTMAPYLELQGAGEKVEEAYVSVRGGKLEEDYLTMDDAKTGKHKTMPKQDSLDNGYLDMNQSKALVEATRQKSAPQQYSDMKLSKPKGKKQTKSMKNTNLDLVNSAYTNMEFETKDYENVTKKMAPPVSQKPGDTPRVGRGDSIPEGFAPPPPNPLDEENNYMNLRLKP